MKTSLEFKVGAMTLAALFVLTFAVLFLSNFSFSPGNYVVTADFNFLGGLKVNAPIRYAGGIDVGRVKAIRPDHGKAAVDMLITEKDFKLRTDSLVALYGDGLLGSRYVQIGADLGTGDELKAGDSIVGKDANNLDQTFSQLGDVMQTFEKMMGDPKSQANFMRSFENLNKVSEQLLELTTTSREKIEKILTDLSKSSGSVTDIVSSVKGISKSLDTLSTTLDKKDINQAIHNFNSTMITVNQLAQDVHSGKGTIGVLLQDQQMADDVKGLVEELKAHPWKLLWKK